MDYLKKRQVAGEIARVADSVGGAGSLAEKLEVRRSTISRWLAAKSMPNEDFVEKLVTLGADTGLMSLISR